MDKRIIAVSIAAFMMFTAVSCGSNGSAEIKLPELTTAQPKVTEPPIVFDEDDEDNYFETKIPIQVDPDMTNHFRWGVWFSYSDSGSYYYFFRSDGSTGCKVNADNGVSTPFAFEKSAKEGEYIFHYERSDNNTPAAVEFPDYDHAVMLVAGRPTEKLVFISSDVFETFMFYTSEEIQSMSERYFESHALDKKAIRGFQSRVANMEDGKVKVTLYIITTDKETKKSIEQVMDVYTVDRLTAMGNSEDGNFIDLST